MRWASGLRLAYLLVASWVDPRRLAGGGRASQPLLPEVFPCLRLVVDELRLHAAASVAHSKGVSTVPPLSAVLVVKLDQVCVDIVAFSDFFQVSVSRQ